MGKRDFLNLAALVLPSVPELVPDLLVKEAQSQRLGSGRRWGHLQDEVK